MSKKKGQSQFTRADIEKSKKTRLDNMKKNQLAIIDLLPKVAFNKTEACKQVGITYRTLVGWIQKYSWFAQAVKDAQIEQSHWVETQLMKKIASGDTQAIKFYLGTKGRDIGYFSLSSHIPPEGEEVKELEEVERLDEDALDERIKLLESEIGESKADNDYTPFEEV